MNEHMVTVKWCERRYQEIFSSKGLSFHCEEVAKWFLLSPEAFADTLSNNIYSKGTCYVEGQILDKKVGEMLKEIILGDEKEREEESEEEGEEENEEEGEEESEGSEKINVEERMLMEFSRWHHQSDCYQHLETRKQRYKYIIDSFISRSPPDSTLKLCKSIDEAIAEYGPRPLMLENLSGRKFFEKFVKKIPVNAWVFLIDLLEQLKEKIERQVFIGRLELQLGSQPLPIKKNIEILALIECLKEFLNHANSSYSSIPEKSRAVKTPYSSASESESEERGERYSPKRQKTI